MNWPKFVKDQTIIRANWLNWVNTQLAKFAGLRIEGYHSVETPSGVLFRKTTATSVNGDSALVRLKTNTSAAPATGPGFYTADVYADGPESAATESDVQIAIGHSTDVKDSLQLIEIRGAWVWATKKASIWYIDSVGGFMQYREATRELRLYCLQAGVSNGYYVNLTVPVSTNKTIYWGADHEDAPTMLVSSNAPSLDYFWEIGAIQTNSSGELQWLHSDLSGVYLPRIGLSGDLVVDGQTLTFAGGLLVASS